ncbi:PadR family transcriptional regulator [Loigolactobacillus coryniformis]|jgi:DNA-binding PadR family transcriptional regulator|uniref:Transcriptional regulator n=2 Tax=Loigolactobacillus coryniformis TaxID=1610 RepID=J3EPP6_9LACO|nr:PadR family transcriptional regulator [Loigolactobacillus coryniformis]ATO44744.1 PadR family transcriptional regulator [Loigolactobacillus coryniformis subsp. torquens DSM 20004 = KCTC 3535]EJN55135.1 Transcriptional regulator [Loigolactobacillus coryniformis subsp. coryniformis CECT 5711]KRK84451.1 regulator of phenolic acid metabolism PadR [Loigolactobacillus coryniformis subsp. torquens DSM 20004 = KCTC 3535]MDT3391831.1 PadR family transcriptional regulator [Bacillota bacterium]
MAQKNKLKYIILGLLGERALTGYDIAKAFTADIGEFWSANHSQIYPLLKRLETAGLITHQLQVSGEKLEKKVYSLTAAGQAQLQDWLHEPTRELTASKDEFILKLYFVQNANDPLLPPMLTEQLNLHQAKLAHLKQQMARKFSDQASQIANYGHFLILQHAIEREQGYADWLARTLAQKNEH